MGTGRRHVRTWLSPSPRLCHTAFANMCCVDSLSRFAARRPHLFRPARTRVSPVPSSSLEAAVFPNWTAVALFIALRGNSVAKGKLQSTQPTSGCQVMPTFFLALCKHRFRYYVARQVPKHPFKSKLHILRPNATIPDYVVCLGHAVGRSRG